MAGKVSVIIPTHNRAALLGEAVASVRAQTYTDWEIVIVDDGSEPPVDAAALHAELGERIRLVRNQQPMRLAYARDQGVRAASGDMVTHLEDDDLLAPDALERGVNALRANPDLELLFLGVRGFGARGGNFDRSQEPALAGVLERAQGSHGQDGVIRFDAGLFKALLASVPMAFQRSIMHRPVWHGVSSLRKRAYMRDPDIADEEQAMRRIRPPLRDSEWALYAAASCTTGLLNAPLYLQRCDGQGYVSVGAQRERSVLSGIDIKCHLFSASQALAEFRPWQAETRDSLAKAYFDQSYFYYHDGRRVEAYRALLNAIRVKPDFSFVRFGLRMLLPKNDGPE